MRYSLALAGLVALAAAAPTPMKHDDAPAGYDPYKSYTPYSPAIEDAAAKMDMEKRSKEMANDINYSSYPSYKPYAHYDPYSAAVDEAGAKEKRNEIQMAGYDPYKSYTPYSPAVEDAAAKMDMAKRHELTTPSSGNVEHAMLLKKTNTDGWVEGKRGEADVLPSEPRKYQKSYGTYDPYVKYTGYTSYKRDGSEEA